MAISATITLAHSSITVGQVLNATLTVSNSSGTDVNVTQILPRVHQTGNPVPVDGSSVSYGDVPLSQGFNNVVPASGSAKFPLSYCIYSPSTGPSDTGTHTYSVDALIFCNDRSTTTPTAATVTVHPVLPLF